MAGYSRIEVVRTMGAGGMVPVFYHPDPEICKNVIRACYEGGARVFEFTNRGDLAHEVFRELKGFVTEALPGMILGVGSVIDAGTTALYLQLGADFIVSPLVNAEMARCCNRRKVAWMPGCGSVTEISYAEELGAEVVKIFPGAQVGGPSFVKAVKGPMPWSSIMPTGGVAPEKEALKAWFDAGVHCVGMGGKLFPAGPGGDYDYEAVTGRVREVMDIIADLRK
ncbi:bifunctional 4-hydroxy-2-oxoglutarate aldolase/2-dehydro-3-deoxy-phosphogluconate aldolase [Sinomicrobium soli]|uniref:bifunctional 4-hydroxy-2-oxoglutarate aldolase/2-dehydro-3-deoxy-phosphogluconate aldolase n=1 Tax=Sinomicrobium sp. N-1-3-6 TaxID=2219864 RepID=UPI000DCB09C8|nr:bifunctional 4-hydroxy-2-oxoglutarate aldolase/2-dehydro-3-deoxy-phosphogluconate aldolase [Sinomicrobium sp. N-1-3-6]RAV28188.1 bifunctional 4-hydroxy-2-oxoglutarate aldolase/2-dehydro-3-deoxy-phosphogluconate aldolase [Sinomicrobium sp. N-1-3-6]